MPSTDGDTAAARKRLSTIAWGALYVVGAAAALRAVLLLVDNPLTSALLGALVVSLMASRAGVRSEGGSAPARKRALYGASMAAAALAMVTVAALIGGGALSGASLSSAMIFGAVEAVALAFRNELWLRGIPLLFAKRAGVSTPVAIAFCVVAGVAAVALEPGARPAGLIMTAASSALFAALWVRGGDAWAPVTAHFVWIWATDSLLAGELLNLETTAGLTHAPSASGVPAWVAAVAFGLLAALVLRGVVPVAAVAAQVDPLESTTTDQEDE
jgi:hypothetical protein